MVCFLVLRYKVEKTRAMLSYAIFSLFSGGHSFFFFFLQHYVSIFIFIRRIFSASSSLLPLFIDSTNLLFSLIINRSAMPFIWKRSLMSSSLLLHISYCILLFYYYYYSFVCVLVQCVLDRGVQSAAHRRSGPSLQKNNYFEIAILLP